MKIKIDHISQILDDRLTISQRGLLITILLLKERDSKLTLAKVKVKIKMSEFRSDLIKLHEMNLIEWSSYDYAVQLERNQSIHPDVVETINFMNELYSRDFDAKSKSTTSGLMARLQQYPIQDILAVVANRYAVWKGDAVMEKYLNPTTIFRASKFDKYLEETRRTKQGERFIAANKNDLKTGDEITLEASKLLIDEELYQITINDLSEDGGKVGNGMDIGKYGKAIKIALNTRQGAIDHGGFKPFEYIYKSK